MHAVHKMHKTVCVSVWWTHGWAVLCETGEPIEYPFRAADSRGSKKPCIIEGVKIRRINSQPRGVTNRRCGLLLTYFGHLIWITD